LVNDALVFGTATGKPHAQSNVRRTMANVVKRANKRLEDAGQVPLPPPLAACAPAHGFASVMFALGEPVPVVMADGGWADPKVALRVYAHAMRRDDQENEALRALVEGAGFGSFGSGADSPSVADQVERAR
jgi:integrase